MSLKLFGSFLLTNSYQNVRYCTCNLSFNFNRCNCLKSSSVWALHYPIIIRRARFCNFDMWFPSNPQFVIPNLGCKRINESFINFMAEMGKYRFNLFIMPSVHEILLPCVWVPIHHWPIPQWCNPWTWTMRKRSGQKFRSSSHCNTGRHWGLWK